MNVEKMFDPNSYSQKAMPLITALNSAFRNVDKFGDVSDDIKEIRNKTTKDFGRVEYDLMDKVQTAFTEEYSAELYENFNKGFKLGAMLMMELFGKENV